MNDAMRTSSAAIWDHLHQGLRAFIVKRVTSEADADDLLQEVFLRVHRQVGQLKHPDRLLPWIFTIARHAIIDHYRSAERHPERTIGLAGDLEEKIGMSQSTDTMSDDARRDLAGCLRPMVEKLPVKYREAVTLIEFEGLTGREAASRLGLSIAGMKSRVQRGRHQLKQMLDQCCVIQLDSRRGIAEYEPRHPDGCGADGTCPQDGLR
jgi:RNA polymerase sigma-70 factor (ECF subfamily)